jgi:hypothetical protein
MDNRILKYTILICLLFLYPFNSYAETNACLACHETLKQDKIKSVTENWLRSIHKQNGVTCDACHGGNPDIAIKKLNQISQKELAKYKALSMSRAKGFIGIPKGKVMFDVCGKCHNDSVNRYKNSIMGVAYLDNKGGPSCTDCHSAHYVIIPDVPNSCERCHKDTTGFDQIDPMNVNDATINELSGVKIKLAEEKIKGKEPPLFPEELGSFQIGFVAFGAILVLLVISFVIYIVMEKGR